MKGLSAIVGQGIALGVLQKAIARDRVASAYLFEGMAGIGKATTALALAQALNCEAEPGRGCGVCASCEGILAGTHPDLIVLRPDGAFIKIGQVRQATARTAFRPHQGRARLLLLDPADTLGLEAAHALLKTLEEPPQETHFVLVSAAPERLPLTIRSRCQRVRFAPLPASAIAEFLVQQRGVAEEQARAIGALAHGSLARAAELASGDVLAHRQALVARVEQAVAAASPRRLFEAAAELKEERQEVPGGLELLRTRYRDALLASEGALEGRALCLDEPGKLAPLVALGPGRLRRRIDTVIEAETALLANANLQLCMERMMLRLREC